MKKHIGLEVDGLLVSMQDFELAAVAQVLRCIAKTVVVSIVKECLIVCSRYPPPNRPMGRAAAGTFGQMERTTCVGQ